MYGERGPPDRPCFESSPTPIALPSAHSPPTHTHTRSSSPSPQGEVVPAERIISSAGFKKGEHYHIDDGQDAINNIYACGARPGRERRSAATRRRTSRPGPCAAFNPTAAAPQAAIS